MIDHDFKPHDVWKDRDQCEHRLDEEKDGAYGICAAPRSEHMDEVQGLRIQLATALRERDEARALKLEEVMGATKRVCDERDAANARADAAEARLSNARRSAETFAKDLREAREALAAARRECDLLRAALQAVADRCMARASDFKRCEITEHQIARAALSSGGESK